MRWLYPALVVTPIGVAIVLAQSAAPPELVLTVPIAVLATLLVILERYVPHHQRQKQGPRYTRVDLYHTVVNGVVQLGTRIAAGVVLLRLPIQPDVPSPSALAGLWAFICADLTWYWVHRGLHHGPQWTLHRVHHSPSRGLYWLNASRSHVFEASAVTLNLAVFLWIFQTPPTTAACVLVASATFTLLQHSNIRLRLGVLNYVFAGPELHRWHHVKESSRDYNFGIALSLWDRLFGTFLWAQHPPTQYGLRDAPLADNYWAHLSAPFRRKSK